MSEHEQNDEVEQSPAAVATALPRRIEADSKSGIFTRGELENPPTAGWDEPAQPMVVTKPDATDSVEEVEEVEEDLEDRESAEAEESQPVVAQRPQRPPSLRDLR